MVSDHNAVVGRVLDRRRRHRRSRRGARARGNDAASFVATEAQLFASPAATRRCARGSPAIDAGDATARRRPTSPARRVRRAPRSTSARTSTATARARVARPAAMTPVATPRVAATTAAATARLRWDFRRLRGAGRRRWLQRRWRRGALDRAPRPAAAPPPALVRNAEVEVPDRLLLVADQPGGQVA